MNNIYWFSGLNSQDNDKYLYYIQMYSVAVITALNTTPNIKPYLILDGEVDEHIQKLIDMGLTVIKHRSLFYEDLVKHYGTDTIALGAYLRIDIPKICEKLNIDSDYVLYTDNDVMFINDVSELYTKHPKYFLIAGEFSKVFDPLWVNSGVMWINWKNMRDKYDEFVEFIKHNFNKFATYDQDAIKQFYGSSCEELDWNYNYKPYWGKSDTIKILHFHGPKPAHVDQYETYPYKNLYTPFYFEMVKYFYNICNEYKL